VILCRKFVGSLTFENFLPRRSGWCRSVVLSMLWWALRYVACMTWLVFICDMTHSHVWNDSFVCVTWLNCTCGLTYSHVWHDSFTRVTWLMYLCGISYSYVWHESCTCTRVTWLIHMCVMTHSYVRRDSLVCMTWLIRTCDMTHSYIRRDLSMCVTWLVRTCATWRIRTCSTTYSYVRQIEHAKSLPFRRCPTTGTRSLQQKGGAQWIALQSHNKGLYMPLEFSKSSTERRKGSTIYTGLYPLQRGLLFRRSKTCLQ